MRQEHSEAWYSKSWRPTAAFVYLAICLIDFALIPMYMASHPSPLSEVVKASLLFPDPLLAFKTIQASQVWTPLTFAYNGMFHAVFGAVLGVSVWSRGQEKIAKVKSLVTTKPAGGSDASNV